MGNTQTNNDKWIEEDIPKSLELFFGHVSRHREHFDNLYWKTINHFTTAVYSTITITIGFITAVTTLLSLFSIPTNMRIFTWIVLFFPGILIATSYVGYRSVERIYYRFMEWVAMLAKTERAMGLHKEVPESKMLFTVERTLLTPEKTFINTKIKDTDEFLKEVMKSDNTIWSIAKKQFHIFGALGVLLFIFSFVMIYSWYFFIP